MFSTLFRGRKPAPSASSVTPQASAAQLDPSNTFAQFRLKEEVIQGAEAAGYQQPTPIQRKAIPLVLGGRDLIGSAQTGTGKTAAFALPILSLLDHHQRRQGKESGCRVLVLEPTRELALQVTANFQEYAKFSDLRTTAIYGGVGYGKQREDLNRGVDILVATPGRLIDLLEQGDISLRGISILVLDEVDRMLDMGFLPTVKRIVEGCPKNRQTLFFSATLPPEIESLTRWALRPDPAIIEIGERRSPAETVTHAFYPVDGTQKFDLLMALLEETGGGSTLIFTRTKHGADKIARRLVGGKHKTAVLHGNRSQSQRVKALDGFRDGSVQILVATDIAARGIDVAGVTHVINYDVPRHPEDYVHRIGRTGRAQQIGDAFTLLSGAEDADAARDIERFIGAKVPRKNVEGFTYSAINMEPARLAPTRRERPGNRDASGSGRRPANRQRRR